MVHVIKPYVTKWGDHRVWVFDDPDKGLIKEALVSGTDEIMDALSSRFHDGDQGFELNFSDKPFEGAQFVFDWVESDYGENLAEGMTGNWYVQRDMGLKGWLCPALFKYFDKAPAHIFVKAAPLSVPLEHTDGQVVIQQ